MRRGADTDRGDGYFGSDCCRDRLQRAFHHNGKRSCFSNGFRVGHYFGGFVMRAAGGAEAAGDVHRLRHQANMAANRHAALCQELNRFGHFHTAFQLHGLAAGFGQHAGSVGKCLLRRFLVAAEWQIHHHTGMLRAAHHGGAVRDHRVERYTQRARQTVQNHAERIAHQQYIAMRIEQAGDRRGVGSQPNLRPTFHAAQIRHCYRLIGRLDAHKRIPASAARIDRRPISVRNMPSLHSIAATPR